MNYPPPSHDIWITVLDHVGDHQWSQLKHCNLVCHAWHTYLQAHLMAAVFFNETTLPTCGDVQLIQRNGHFVKQLAIRCDTWHRSRWLEALDLMTGSFNSLVTLKLLHVEFFTAEDLQNCISTMPKSLEHLIIFNCACREASGVSEMPKDRALAQPYNHALQTVQIDSEHRGYFACVLWNWFAAGLMISVLRDLDIRLETHDIADHCNLFEFLSRSECAVEKLKLTFGEFCNDDMMGM
jgi:hypothetical protein